MLKYIILGGLFLLEISPLFAQSCSQVLSGKVIDASTEEPLAFATIWVENLEKGLTTNANGTFELAALCTNEYQLKISSLGYGEKEIHVVLSGDTMVIIGLQKSSVELDVVEVEGKAGQELWEQQQTTIDTEDIAKDGGKSLAEITATVGGVSTLQTGTGLAKPIIHGLYGNRVVIVNNDLPQSGQQWGNDHAPEIDPNAATSIHVVKGVGAIEYGSNAIGGVVRIDNEEVSDDTQFEGGVNYTFESNGRGHHLSTHMQKGGGWMNWKMTGSAKISGDRHTPDYYLRNTGVREGNISIQVNKRLNKRWSILGYYSLFTTQIGILRGAHVGNLTDLEQAIGRSQPFFTQEEFSYTIEAPQQKVQHHLLKWKAKYQLNEYNSLEFLYGGQLNKRQEFDVRRSGRSDIPAMSMFLQTQEIKSTWKHLSRDAKKVIKSGVIINWTDNSNDTEETGILPLIPDYQYLKLGAFVTYKQKMREWEWEVGGRYDRKYEEVLAISRDLPRRIIRYTPELTDYALIGGIGTDWWEGKWQTNWTLAWTQRAAAINERFSFGLHQGVSGIEEGQIGLNAERSLKAVWNNNIAFTPKVSLNTVVYGQVIDDYIYLIPQDELRLTIRGAFPVYRYEQTDAFLWGGEAIVNWQLSSQWKWRIGYALVRGINRTSGKALTFIPADNWQTTMEYEWPKWGVTFSSTLRYVAEQKRWDETQDFLAPPADYWLLDGEISKKITLMNKNLTLSLQINNVLNQKYRNYLNRQRYFADEMGRNSRFQIRWLF